MLVVSCVSSFVSSAVTSYDVFTCSKFFHLVYVNSDVFLRCDVGLDVNNEGCTANKPRTYRKHIYLPLSSFVKDPENEGPEEVEEEEEEEELVVRIFFN